MTFLYGILLAAASAQFYLFARYLKKQEQRYLHTEVVYTVTAPVPGGMLAEHRAEFDKHGPVSGTLFVFRVIFVGLCALTGLGSLLLIAAWVIDYWSTILAVVAGGLLALSVFGAVLFGLLIIARYIIALRDDLAHPPKR